MSPLAIVVAAAAAAGQPSVEAPAEPAADVSSSIITPIATDVPGQTANIVSGGTTDLAIDEDKSELTLGYAWAGRRQTTLDGFSAHVIQDAFSLELSLPLGGGDNLLTREAFEGLRDGPALSFSWTSFQTRSGDPYDMDRNPLVRSAAREAETQCLARVQAGTAPVGYTDARCRLEGPRPTGDFLRTFSPHSVSRLNRMLLTPTIGYGLEGSIGINRYSYRTPLTLAEGSDTEPQFSIKAYGILFPSNGVSMLTISAAYENGFEAQDDQILCRAVVTDPNSDCANAAPGPPVHVERVPFGIEYRHVFDRISGLGRIAAAPRATIDALSGDYTLELPLYLMPSRDIRLLPGVSISYDSRHDDVVFGLFLRRRFTFGG